MTAMHVLTTVVLGVALWSVLCRINSMQRGVTEPRVFGQHFVLGMGLAAALVLPSPLAKLALALAVLVWLLLSAQRWRYGAPEGTRSDHGDLDDEPHAHAAAGGGGHDRRR